MDDPAEMGLAAALDPGTKTLFVAATDASRGKVLELKRNEKGWETSATYIKAIGTFAGKAELEKPTDAAYTVRDGKLQLFVIDGGNRLVRVR